MEPLISKNDCYVYSIRCLRYILRMLWTIQEVHIVKFVRSSIDFLECGDVGKFFLTDSNSINWRDFNLIFQIYDS